MKINEYIESGILEAYVLGSASEAEANELLHLKAQHPEIEDALFKLESDLERIAEHMAIAPPPNTWAKIEGGINELVKTPQFEYLIGEEPKESSRGSRSGKSSQFIEVEAESGHMRIHKIWRWVFLGVFILGKIFLAFAIYYYLENRHTQEEIEKLKTELENRRSK